MPRSDEAVLRYPSGLLSGLQVQLDTNPEDDARPQPERRII